MPEIPSGSNENLNNKKKGPIPSHKRGRERLICSMYAIATNFFAQGTRHLYDIHQNDLYLSYGKAFALPAVYYFATRAMLPESRYVRSWENTALPVMACSILEIAQGLGIWPGTYDPMDFVAYAAGATFAYTVDRITFHKSIRTHS